jgi:GAF domain-containing protein
LKQTNSSKPAPRDALLPRVCSSVQLLHLVERKMASALVDRGRIVMESDVLDPSGALAELSAALLSNQDMHSILQAVAELSRRHIPGSEDCSITLVRGDRGQTVASTGQLATDLDEAQYGQDWGPCLDAGRTDQLLLLEDMATERRWPRYTPIALEVGARSSLSVPLPVENYLVGALNAYATRPGAFTDDSVRIGVSLAAHITAALSYAESATAHRDRVGQLNRALESRSIIEQAKGMIMMQQRCSAEDAFALLRKLSMDENVRLQDLATSLVASASGHPVRVRPTSP